jgi:putative ABC transport system permease protein
VKYLRLVFRNLGRNKKRTALTVLSLAFSLLLITFLRTLVVEFSKTNESPAAVRRVITRRSSSLQELLPESYGAKIRTIPGVEYVMANTWFGGIYQEPKNFFANFAVEHQVFFDITPEVELDEAAREAFLQRRTAAFCGRKLAERFGWKVGDKITLLGTIYPVDLEFDLVGVYRSSADERSFYFRRDYLEESLGKPGRAGVFVSMCRTPEDVPRVITAIDTMFRNTDAETLTETERAFEASFQSLLGNVKGLVMSIASVVVFMILLVCGNTMAMNIRERTHEIAILKSLGFQRETLFGMLVGESVLISFVGGGLGTVGAKVLFGIVDMATLSQGFIQSFGVDTATLMLGLGISLAVGLVSGTLPAYQASKRTVAEGLRLLG